MPSIKLKSLKIFKKHKYEFFLATMLILALLIWKIPNFLNIQHVEKVDELQTLVDQIALRFLEEPFLFYDLYMEDDLDYASALNGRFELSGNELNKIIPGFKLNQTIQNLIFYFEGGHISANKNVWRNMKDYDPERHWVYVYVNINGSDHDYTPSTIQGRMIFPSTEVLYDPTNGLKSAGILYAHTYEIYKQGKQVE